MASPPNYSATSPPAPGSLALPRQRPTLALPGAPSASRRKLSTTSASSSAHPLRQTSFPPPESRGAQHQLFSPDGSPEFSDSEITSAIGGTQGDGDGQGAGTGRKRKRGEKKARGRPPKNASVVNGEDGRSKRGGTAGAASGVNGHAPNDAEPEDDDDDDDEEITGGKQALKAIDELFAKQNEEVHALLQHMPQWQQDRFAAYKRVKLRTADVRKLVNQTLSQSVPANVVSVVSSYTKIFAGMLIENAREVQAEWMAVEERLPDGRENGVAKRLRRGGDEDVVGKGDTSAKSTQQNGSGEASSNGTLALTNGHANSDDTQANTDDGHEKMLNGHAGDEDDDDGEGDASLGLRREIEECDRGPILPDHLREALRRYKKSRYGGVVGFTGHSLEGKEVAAPKMGGKRLFR